MSVIDDTEMSLGLLSCSTEGIYLNRLFITYYLHVLSVSVMNPVGSYSVIICGGWLEACDSYLHDMRIHISYAIASAVHLRSIRQVGHLTIYDISVGIGSNAEGYAHAGFGIVLQHGSTVYQSVGRRSVVSLRQFIGL